MTATFVFCCAAFAVSLVLWFWLHNRRRQERLLTEHEDVTLIRGQVREPLSSRPGQSNPPTLTLTIGAEASREITVMVDGVLTDSAALRKLKRGEALTVVGRWTTMEGRGAYRQPGRVEAFDANSVRLGKPFVSWPFAMSSLGFGAIVAFLVVTGVRMESKFDGMPCPEGATVAYVKDGPNHISSGTIVRECRLGGLRHGTTQVFDISTMNELERMEYRHERRHGVYAAFYALGKPRTLGRYQRNQRDGPWLTWDPKGKLLSRGRYVQGRRFGYWVWWAKRGPLTWVRSEEGNYDVEGRRTGRWIFRPDAELYAGYQQQLDALYIEQMTRRTVTGRYGRRPRVVKREVHYFRGEPHGPTKLWMDNLDVIIAPAVGPGRWIAYGPEGFLRLRAYLYPHSASVR